MTVEHDVLGDLMRDSLDHCVKCTICETYCPVSNVDAAVPGPEVRRARRPSASGCSDEASPDASLDYCSGCGVCTQVCPQGVHIAEINTQARAKMRERTGFKLRDRLLARPDVLGRLSTPVAPARELHAAQQRCGRSVEKLVGLDRGAALPAYPRHARSSAGRASAHSPPGDAPRRLLPRLRRQLVGAAHRPAWRSSCSSGWAARSTSRSGQLCCGLPAQSNGMFDLARKYTRRMAGVLAPSARDGVDIVGTSHELHADAQARGARDPRARGRRRPAVGERPHLRHLRVPARCCTTAASCARTSSRCRSRSPTTLPASSRVMAIGKPALDLMALVPGAAGDRERRDVLRRRRHLRPQEREVRHRDEGRASGCSARSRTPSPSSRCATPRPAAGTSRRPPACGRCTRSRSCTAPPGSAA